MQNNVFPQAFNAAQFQAISGSKSFGPLTINYNIDFSIPQIAVSASLAGVSIGNVTINPQNPTVTLGGSVGFAKAEIKLTANFATKHLDYNIDVEVFSHTVFNGSGTLFSWGALVMAAAATPGNISADEVKQMLAASGITDINTLAYYVAESAGTSVQSPGATAQKGMFSNSMIVGLIWK